MNPQTSPTILRLGGWMVAAFVLMVIIVTLSVVAPGTVSGLIDGGRLLYGWIVVLIRGMDQFRNLGLKEVVLLLSGLSIAPAMVHAILLIIRTMLLARPDHWRFQWSVRIVLIACCLVAGAGSMASLIFQTRLWMSVRQDVARGQENQARLEKFHFAARVYAADHSGSYPWFLQDLLEEKCLDRTHFEDFRHMVLSDGMKVPCMMLGGMFDATSESLPHVVSVLPIDGLNYGAVLNSRKFVLLNREEYESLIERWREEVADDKYLGQAVPLLIPSEERTRRAQLQARGGGVKGSR